MKNLSYNKVHKVGEELDISYLKQKRILLVDDEPELLDMVVSILKEYDFEDIQTAQTVGEAVSVAEEYSPEFAILDVMLPDGDGFSLMKILKEQKDYPILFLTAKGEDEDKLEGLGLGADDYTTRNIEKIEQCDLLTWVEIVEVIGMFI